MRLRIWYNEALLSRKGLSIVTFALQKSLWSCGLGLRLVVTPSPSPIDSFTLQSVGAVSAYVSLVAYLWSIHAWCCYWQLARDDHRYIPRHLYWGHSGVLVDETRYHGSVSIGISTTAVPLSLLRRSVGADVWNLDELYLLGILTN